MVWCVVVACLVFSLFFGFCLIAFLATLWALSPLIKGKRVQITNTEPKTAENVPQELQSIYIDLKELKKHAAEYGTNYEKLKRNYFHQL